MWKVGQIVHLSEEGENALNLPEGTEGTVTAVNNLKDYVMAYKYPIRVRWNHPEVVGDMLMRDEEVVE